MTSPHVAISGGGPAGFLLGILLADLGVRTTVIEKSSVADPWSTRSYSINLNARGLTALESAGVLEAAKAKGMARHQVVLESVDGKQKKIPRSPPHYAFSRPDLVECLESILKEKPAEHVTIQRGVGVANVEEKEDQIVLKLEDGSKITCTHVIGADGKWSAVRNSLSDWKDTFAVQSEAAFGIFIKPSKCSDRWDRDATSVFRSSSPKYYVIAAPLLNDQFSVTMVCYDQVKEDHPWLVPQEDEANIDWESEYGTETANADFQTKFAQMLQEELPNFYKDIQGSLGSVRVNRRTSWLKPLVENPSYCSQSGRVALVGDASHAMTASAGEGCNCALESAVSLIQPLSKDRPVTVDDLTRAFKAYGAKRPSEVIPIQEKSAAGNRYKKPVAPGAGR